MAKKRTRADAGRENGKLGGRPPGTRNPETLEKEQILKAHRMRIMQIIEPLFIAQANIAMGVMYLFRVVDGDAVQVTDVEEIRKYLSGEFRRGTQDEIEDGDEEPEKPRYYYLTTERPDNKAIEAMHDRLWGKPAQPIEVHTEPFTVDDVRTLLASLPQPRQQYFYDIITDIIAEADELSRRSAALSGNTALPSGSDTSTVRK